MSLWSRLREKIGKLGGHALVEFFSTSKPPEASEAFAMAVVALGAKMAKADGRVTRDEVIAFREVFSIDDRDLRNVERFFDLARRDTAGFELYAQRIGRMFRGRQDVLETLLDGLFHIARADHELHRDELNFLETVSESFGLDRHVFEHTRLRNTPGEGSPYEILGVDPDASMAEIRRAWRALAARYHPDRLRGQGVPVEAAHFSEVHLVEINAAYDSIRRARLASLGSVDGPDAN